MAPLERPAWRPDRLSRISTCSPPLSALSAACSTRGQRDGSRVRRMVRLSAESEGSTVCSAAVLASGALDALKASSTGAGRAAARRPEGRQSTSPVPGCSRRPAVGRWKRRPGPAWFRRRWNRGVARGDDRRLGDGPGREVRVRGRQVAGDAGGQSGHDEDRRNDQPDRIAPAERTASFVRLSQHGCAVTIRWRGLPAAASPVD